MMLNTFTRQSADKGAAPTTVAVMQPYFYPYAGYFRLFASADYFIILDCVQFPRRGRVHRCEVPAPGGGTEWLTLPLARQPRETLIRDLAFAPGARAEMASRFARHRWIAAAQGPHADPIRTALFGPMDSVTDYLEDQLRVVTSHLGLTTTILRSSQFALKDELRGQERIIALTVAAGGAVYVNPPGGRSFYDEAAFQRAGLQLKILSNYDGPHKSILPNLLQGSPETLRHDILSTCCFMKPSSPNV